MSQQTPREALDEHERKIADIIKPAFDAAIAALHAASDEDLQHCLRAGDRAKRALEEAEGRLPALRAAVARADATKIAEDERTRLAVAEEVRRAAEDAKRIAHEAEQAPHLAALAVACDRADVANVASAASEVARAPFGPAELVAMVIEKRTGSERKACVDRVRARLAAEAIDLALVNVDPTNPSAVAAREQVRAMAVHTTIADIDEARALFAAARFLSAAAHDRLGDNATNPIAAAVIALDGATTHAEKDRALEIAASTDMRRIGITRAEIGRLTLEGRGHEIHARAGEVSRSAELAKLAAGVTSGPRGSVVAARGAVAIVAHARRSGLWAADESTCRDLIGAAGTFLADQAAALIPTQGTGQAFRVATTPDGPVGATLPRLIKDGARPGDFTEAAPARDQIAAFLGLTGDLADLADDLIPIVEVRSHAFADMARGAA